MRSITCGTQGFVRVLTVVAVLVSVVPDSGPAYAQGKDPAPRLDQSRYTGLTSFVRPVTGPSIPVQVPTGGRVEPILFLRQYSHLFGIASADVQLRRRRVEGDTLGHRHTTYDQVHRGVPVFSGVLKVHQRQNGDIASANGAFYPIPATFDITPALSGTEAARIARVALSRPGAQVEHSDLVIVDPGWYGDPPLGPRLAYYVTLADPNVPLRQSFFVDARSGETLDQWDVLHTARIRNVHDAGGTATLPGALARAEGDPPIAAPADVNRAYDYSGDTYDYYFRGFGRDSINNAGMILKLTANFNDRCPNAFWYPSLQQMVFCLGLVTDDVTGHELTHGVTQHTANLIYQNESGQMNEAFSDIFGELIDLFNGNAAFAGPPAGLPWPAHATGAGTDTPNGFRTACSPNPGHPDGVRWLVGEDVSAPGLAGALRDMWNPTCFNHPDRLSSPLQTCNTWDNGGVHSGSGIMNHAFAILTDGKTFNGQTVAGIGPIKAAAVWYRALTVYMTPAMAFGDAFVALNQAANDLIGEMVSDPRPGGAPLLFTFPDAEEVDKALRAVEMNLPGGACPRGACCNPIAGTCIENVLRANCPNAFHPGKLCSQITPACTAPTTTARMIVLLDRTGSMQVVRPSTGNTRCRDALNVAKQDVTQFTTSMPNRTVAVRTFSGADWTDLTGGFTGQAAALAALDSLDSLVCGAGTPLAESICAAVDGFPAGLTTRDKVLMIASDGGENFSDGPCMGPASEAGPPPSGNYDVGSWQAKVYAKVNGSVTPFVRDYTNFGGISQGINLETGMPLQTLVPDSLLFQDIAGGAGGGYSHVDDNGPLPGRIIPNVVEVPSLSAAGAILLILGVVTLATWTIVRRRRQSQAPTR